MARIAGVNIPQNKLVHIGLTYIYGIGNKFSSQICAALNIPLSKRVNELTDDDILKIREYIDSNLVVEGDLRRDNSLTLFEDGIFNALHIWDENLFPIPYI